MSTPARLHKKEETSIDDWLLSRSHIFLPILFAILFILIGCLIFAIFAMSGVSATESGMVYNHLQDVI